MNKIRRFLYIGLGLLFTGIGVVGIVTPLLPTTVFFLIAGGLFAKASPRLHRWLLNNRITGPFLKAYSEGAGLSRRHKIFTISFLWLTLCISGWFVRETWWIQLILLLVGIGVTWHVLTIKSREGTE
jgi:uncharacterized membrane protein YbaN (DUF454 family)